MNDGRLILHRSEQAFPVLNKYPYNNGHLMAVPYRHVDTLEALTAEEATHMMAEVALGIRALRRVSNPEGFNIGVNIGKIAGQGSSIMFTPTRCRAGAATPTSCRFWPTSD